MLCMNCKKVTPHGLVGWRGDGTLFRCISCGKPKLVKKDGEKK